METAIGLADREGLDAVTMRGLGEALGVEAMSLYHHVAGKDELLAGIADRLVSEIEAPPRTGDWRADIRARAIAARRLARRHPWAPRFFASEARVGPALIRYLDEVVGILRAAGFSGQLTHHAMHILDSRLLGFTRDLFDPAEMAPRVPRSQQTASFPPAMAEAFVGVRHDAESEFEFALDLILEGLERARDARR